MIISWTGKGSSSELFAEVRSFWVHNAWLYESTVLISAGIYISDDYDEYASQSKGLILPLYEKASVDEFTLILPASTIFWRL